MAAYRFVGGGHTIVGDQEFQHVGEGAEFSPDLYRDVVLGGAAFIPQEDFDKLNLQPEMLDRLRWSGEAPSAEVLEQFERGRDLFREEYYRLRAEEAGK